MNASSENQTNVDKWTQCEPGTLTKCAAAANVQPLASALPMKIAGLSLAVACGLVALMFSSSLWLPAGDSQNTELPYLGGLTCSTVVDSMPEYFGHELDEQTHRKTTKHLIDCPPCLAKFEREAASRGIKVDLTVASADYSPAMDWPADSFTRSSLAVVSWSAPR